MVGLRERKKAATRQGISDAATRLFEARGFEAVTLAEIAGAADVAQKTIWNYFGSKEELFFDAEPAVLDALVAAVRDGAPLRPLLDRPVVAGPCGWTDLDGGLYEGIRTFLACEQASPTLRARRTTLTWEWAAPLGAASGSTTWGAFAAATILLRHETMRAAMLDPITPATVRRRVQRVLDEAFAALPLTVQR
jgi:AcrR family transcriptional regulator